MIDRSQFSKKLLETTEGQNDEALARIVVAKRRIQSILDRDTVCNQKTLEQKISEQGPREMRVDPHLVGKAILDLLELRRLRSSTHTGPTSWYSNPGTPLKAVLTRLDTLSPLYDSVSGHGFGNLTGDALEIIVWKCLQEISRQSRRFNYQGHFETSAPKNEQGRYRKIQPPKSTGGRVTSKEADFFLFGHTAGPLCIECKNLREWLYPHHPLIKELILKSSELGLIPVLIARRLHYTARTNLLAPAGIIAHESLYQYYPPEYAEVAAQVQHARSLGFTDVVATEEPHLRTKTFFLQHLPSIVDRMADRCWKNEQALVAFAKDEINLAQLYNEIGSPAAGNWSEADERPPE